MRYAEELPGRDYFMEPDELRPCTPEPEVELPPWQGPTEVVGTGLPRIDAYQRVSGSALYTHDRYLPNMLHAAILRCPHAHAIVRRVDAARALRRPGVRAVVTAATPGADIPWYSRSGQPQSKLFDPHCRFQGEEVAAVAAETEEQAWDAVRDIAVDYEVLPFVIDPEEALRPDAPRLHEGGNQEEDTVRRGRGDVERAFAEADVVLEETFTVGAHLHVPMESFGSVASWEGNELTIWDSTQGVYAVLGNVAGALGLPLNNVRVICPYIGGGFGAKLRTGKYTVIAALLARMTGRPVKLFLTREETFTSEGNRPAAKITLKAGVRRDGTLTALKLRHVATGGAYGGNRYTVGAQVLDLYLCPNVDVEEIWAYTNTCQARAMRAPGFPQCSFALEQMVDMLAEAIGIDPVALRVKNVPAFSQHQDNLPYTSTGLADCLKRGAEAVGWGRARGASKQPGTGPWRRGIGVAACNWWAGDGGPPSTAIVRMFVDGSVTVSTGASDLGTGTKTVAAMVAAEELRTDPARIQVIHADTGTTPYHYSSGGSNTLPGAIPAVRLAAYEVKRQLLGFAAEELEVAAADLELRQGAVVSRTDPAKRVEVETLIRSRELRDVIGVGYRGPNPEGKIVRPFAAHFAEVEVNTLTGEVRVLRLLGAHDSGRVINRTTYDNQVHGGMVQGLGFGMTEHRVIDRQTGTVCSANLHDYKVPTALDVPADMEALPIDPGDVECNNLGAKGLGEPPVIPTAAAIANAVYDAVGVRMTSAPIYPPSVLERLAARRRQESRP